MADTDLKVIVKAKELAVHWVLKDEYDFEIVG